MARKKPSMPISFSEISNYIDTIKKDQGFYFASAIIKCLIGNRQMLYFIILAGVQCFLVFRIYRKYSSAYMIAFFLFIAFYVVVAAITLTFMPQILSFFGATPKILPDACAYYSIIIGGLIFDKISFGMNNLVRAEGRPVIAMTTIIIGGLTNIFLDWLFLVKWGWGVRGAAIATVLAQACASSWVLGYYVSGKNFLRIRLSNMRQFKKL